MWKLCLLSLATVALALELVDQSTLTSTSAYGFEVDYENNQFLLDGQPFRYVSGSFHYFRIPKVYWRDRLRKMRAAGLNAVSTYVEWSLHQPMPNYWRWSDDADIVEFLRIAQEEDLLVLLRPGPYICAERDLGGLPFWLMSLVPDIKMRTNDSRYMQYVEVYLNELMQRVEPYLRGNGGPVIMVQIENEYGSFHACDVAYREALRDIISRHVGDKALLYTTDGCRVREMRCGIVAGAYATVDFGSSNSVKAAFDVMRMYQPRGPLVNSEYYSGWLTHWDEEFQRVSTSSFINTLREILSFNASINIYMMYGGTNFGLTSGANGGVDQYSPQITSYDYDAPLTEAGDPTDKYFALRELLAQYLPMPNIPLPTVAPKGSYGEVRFSALGELFSDEGRKLASFTKVYKNAPTFEELLVPFGYVCYETDVPSDVKDPAVLTADVADRALVYLDRYLVGTLSRTLKITSLPLQNPYAKRIQILVENEGHLNFGNVAEDWKGIFNPKIDGKRLENWTISGYPMHNPELLKNFRSSFDSSPFGNLVHGPIVLEATFKIPTIPLDTYLDTTGWGKGIVWINGHNLGRYWPKTGPQVTLYVPSVWLNEGNNSILVFENEYIPENLSMTFRGTPNLGRFHFRT